jgi:hypothetical protein
MQLVCQRNSLNLHGFAMQEITDLSEILTVQKNAVLSMTPIAHKCAGEQRDAVGV